MALHFLHVIGQPYEGQFTVNHTAWRGALIKAKVTSEEYNGYINNKVQGIDFASPETAKKEESVSDEVPF